jgi:hypothetical protein
MALDLDCLTTEYFTGDGVKTAYNLSFDFVDVADINVAWHSSVGSEYTTLPSTDTTYGYQVDTGANGSFIRFNNPPANNQKFFVYRLTSIDPLKADFEPGHPIKAQDLDDNFKQLANAIEDTRCIVEGIVDNELVDPGDIYWKKAGETVYSNNDWASSDCYVASTKAIEQRFSSLVHMGVDPPSGTNYDGQLWWDTDDGNLYVYYSDSDSNQWVEANVTTGEAPSDGLIYGRKDGNWSVVPVWQNGYVSDVPAATGLSYLRTSGAVAGDYGTWTATNVYSNADQTKLAGIEAGATADQTGAEIKAAYEAEADTNAFDDAAVTKLAGIATGAQVNDPNTVVDPNYVATDENFTTADHAKLDGIETAATADQTGAEIKALYEAEANAYTDTKDTKLSGIETGATADQTGAEILTAIKTVDGTGSGLDADLLDGQEGSYYLDYNNFTNTPGGSVTGFWNASGSDIYFSSGNVGIGTSSPEYIFDTRGSINVSGSIFRRSADNATFSITNRANQPIIFGTNDTERMRIDSSGNIGLGTSSPSTVLHIKNNSPYIRLEDINDNQDWEIRGTSRFNIFDITDNTERFSIDTNGNTGVGTASPRRNFHVHNPATATTGLMLTNANTGEANDSQGFQLKVGADSHVEISQMENSHLGIFTNANERMRIDSSGKVGISTTSPSESLEVAGNGLKVSGQTSGVTDGGITFDWDSGSNNGRIFSESAGSSNLLFYTTNSGTRAERMRIDNNGNLGIGTDSPLDALHCSTGNNNDSGEKTIAIGGSINNARTASITKNTSTPYELKIASSRDASFNTAIAFQTRVGNEAMRIDSSGRLLVGHTATVDTSTFNSNLQLMGTDAHGSSATLGRFSADAGAPSINLSKSRSGAKGGHAIVNNNDSCGNIFWWASDGSDYEQVAQIGAEIEGTPGAGDTPGALTFSTTADGASTSTERMRIRPDGRVGIGCTPVRDLQLHASDASSELMLSNTTTGATAGSGFMIQQDGNDTYIWNKENSFMSFGTNALERMKIDSSGNVGINLTPSGSSKLQVGGSMRFASSGAANDSTNPIIYRVAGEDSLAFASGNSERMRIDSSGNVGINTSSPNEGLELFEKSLRFSRTSGVTAHANISLTHVSSADHGSVYLSTSLATGGFVFRTNGSTERLRIAGDGQTYFSSSAPGTTSFGTSIGRAGIPGFFETFRNGGSTAIIAQIGGNSGFANIKGDGDLENSNNSYTGISDIKLKENIVDANSQWDDLKALKVRKYNFKAASGFSTHTQIGLIAQEVELTSPGLVGETTNDDNKEVTKNVNYSVLYMKAVKALQEAMKRIEDLEAKVAALEAG